ncbi:hypothetical protein TPY_2364 [Sulfobacillus acidophilus TPY]|jgi:hypothetical protein|uniref:Aspartyl-phosphate phosphatase Spo0E family protein n=1 Tax=Sulfobacillus acidophilus (strain ATCC 700253 / DSM 10332 / NAL) TaxID=679936 RepID=G8U121_SULAD|nr:hypothetical protein TPY_2364 [Sulfobacillus acidophilus TPY]AEW06566.1 hypothetical protein Sulac_3120 [Sulfobacillus acidophilus DSM 10332]
MTGPIKSSADYRQEMETIRRLKQKLWILATQRGNLDPDVIQLSQEIDRHIVSVQYYWSTHHDASMTG